MRDGTMERWNDAEMDVWNECAAAYHLASDAPGSLLHCGSLAALAVFVAPPQVPRATSAAGSSSKHVTAPGELPDSQQGEDLKVG